MTPDLLTLTRLLSRSEAPRGVLGKLLSCHDGAPRAFLALQDNPYATLLKEGASFEVAERVAELLRLPLEKRVLGNCEYILSSNSVTSISMLVAKLRLALGLADAVARCMLKKNVDDGLLVTVGSLVTTAAHYDKNVSIARDVERRAMPSCSKALLTAFAGIPGVSGDQVAALDKAARHRISVITGGPGTGKSHVVRAMVDAFPGTRVTAPTGRAARNASGKTVHYFRTIQESGKNDFSGCGLVIVDEASMLSTELMWIVLEMAPSDAHIVLVGDVDQLPPIDAGDVLRDLIQSGKVPVTVLSTNRRSNQPIQDFARGILEGRADLPGSGVEIIECHAFNDVMETCTSLASSVAPIASSLILTPHNVTRVKLNKVMQLHRWTVLDGDEVDIVLTKTFAESPKGTRGVATMSGSTVTVCADGGVSFRSNVSTALDLISVDTRSGGIKAEAGSVIVPGDTIIITKNTGDVCNGDLGTFLGGDAVSFEDVRVNIPEIESCSPGMTLAYAVTVHKAQGSEFDAVVLPVTDVNAWDRVLFYTAVTRAKCKVYLLGTPGDLKTIVSCIRPSRPSLLRDLL